MPKNKKINMKNIRSEDLPSKWIDMRAIVPGIVIGLLWALYITFQIPAVGVSEFILAQFSISTTINSADAFIFSMSILIRAFVFIFDFIIAFIIGYFFFWFILREQDKKYYYRLKKEGKL